jgi:exodeoxyribonuclease III
MTMQRPSVVGSTNEVDVRGSRPKRQQLSRSNTTKKRTTSCREEVGNRQSSIVACKDQPPSLLKSASGFSDKIRGLTLNIGAAATTRAENILAWLLARDDDVIVLTETSPGLGTELLSFGLAERGYEIVATPPAKDRGVLIASKVPVLKRLCPKLDVTLPWRSAGVVLDTNPRLAVVGVYVPSRDRSPEKIQRKQRFISSFVGALESLPKALRDNLVIAGDYNVISRRHEPPRKGYYRFEYEMHEALERLGFTAGHELGHNAEHPHSWIGRTGDGYLYDYVHLGGAISSRLETCEYVHDTRQQRLSDHAAVTFACGMGSLGTQMQS